MDFTKSKYKILYTRNLFIIFLVILFLETISAFTLILNGNLAFPFPWTFIMAIKNGEIMQVSISIFILIIMLLIVNLYIKNGIYRVCSWLLIMGLVIIMLDFWLGLIIFKHWVGININFYPWQIGLLINVIKLAPLIKKRFYLSLLIAASLLVVPLLIFLVGCNSNSKIHGNAHFSSLYEIYKSALFSNKGIVIGKKYGSLLKLPGSEGVLVTAPMGSGKTTSIAIPNLIEWEDSGVFNDIKGELYALTAEFRENVLNNACYRWSPASREGSPDQYNPFYYVDKNQKFIIKYLHLFL